MGAPKIDDSQRPDLTEFFNSSAVFSGASSAALDFAMQSCEWLAFKKDAPIILENEINNAVYFVVRGQVEIATYLADEKRIQRLALLKEGSHFGEFSVLTGAARSGSVYAYSDCEVLKMSGADFLSLVEAHADIAINVLGNLVRLSHQSLGADEFIPYCGENTVSLSEPLVQFFPPATWKKFNAVPLAMKAGVLSVAVRDPHHAPLFATLTSSFAKFEISVSLATAAQFETLVTAATAQIKGGLKVQVVKAPVATDLDVGSILKSSTLFARFTDEAMTALLPYLKQVSIKAGTVILPSKQLSDECYVVLKGSVLMSRPLNGVTASAPILVLRPGDIFGEGQVLLESETPCSYRASEDCELVAISKDTLNQLLNTTSFVVDFARALALKLQAFGHISGLRYLASNDVFDANSVASLLSPALLDEERVMPIRISDGELTLGLVHPESSKALTKLGRYLSEYRVRLVGITDEQFQSFKKTLKANGPSNGAAASRGESVVERADVSKWLDALLAEGAHLGASDVHMEPGAAGLTTRFRIDGVLREHGKKLAPELIPQAVNRLKIMANMDIAVQHLPQDGHLEVKSETLKLMARMSTLPTKHGEKIVLRLIRERNSVVPLDMIAPDRRIVSFLKSMSERRQGLFLVTGPTGSGKTTTLYSLLKSINHVNVNVISVEDPIEMEIGGVNQVEINAKRGLEFTQVLRAILRQDPDVLMIGEIRDESSAKIVFDAAMTGRLVLSTLHSGTSFEAIPRLRDLGVSSAQIAEGLLGVATQRLVRSTCKDCAQEHPISLGELEMFKGSPWLEPPTVVRRGAGCEACGNTGYVGRIPAFEIFANTQAISDGIRGELPTSSLEEIARENEFERLYEFGLRLVQSGLTTPEEIRRVLSSRS